MEAGPDSTATVQFGDPSVGSPFPPPVFERDESSNARDNLIPRTSVISQGGTVTFTINGLHQVAVYAAGNDAGRIVVSSAPPPPAPPGVDDSTNRLALSARNIPPAIGTFERTFPTPGRCFILCNIRRHLVDWNMYGWANVK